MKRIWNKWTLGVLGKIGEPSPLTCNPVSKTSSWVNRYECSMLSLWPAFIWVSNRMSGSEDLKRGAHLYTSHRFLVLNVQYTGFAFASRTLERQSLNSDTSNGVRKPSVPIANDATGGRGWSCQNSEVRWSTVPSPPSATQKSTSAHSHAR